jgi:succinate dehydrogenase/fumarate reductase flavoprotein subunit
MLWVYCRVLTGFECGITGCGMLRMTKRPISSLVIRADGVEFMTAWLTATPGCYASRSLMLCSTGTLGHLKQHRPRSQTTRNTGAAMRIRIGVLLQTPRRAPSHARTILQAGARMIFAFVRGPCGTWQLRGDKLRKSDAELQGDSNESSNEM